MKRPAHDEVWIITPPLARISGSAACTTRNAPVRLAPIIFWMPSGWSFDQRRSGMLSPALLTSTSSRPNAAAIASAARGGPRGPPPAGAREPLGAVRERLLPAPGEHHGHPLARERPRLADAGP